MILNDNQIFLKCKYDQMITPFEERKISMINNNKILSRGLSSFGYDLTLAPFLRQRKLPRTNWQDALEVASLHTSKPLIDPKREKEKSFVDIKPIQDFETGESYFVLKPNEFYLGVTQEVFNMPDNVFAIVTNKSTYARCGIDFAITTIEPSWRGALTLEIKNNNPHHSVKLYVGEGCVQATFFEGLKPQNDYGNGKYQDQGEKPQIAK